MPGRTYLIKHNQAVWETMTFAVTLPGPLPDGYEDDVEYIRDHVDELVGGAIAYDINVERGDAVSSIDSDVEIYAEDGTLVYSDVER